MDRGETFKLAVDALRAHKLRSFLTLLGVIIGVAGFERWAKLNQQQKLF